jgi:hypothetical protein
MEELKLYRKIYKLEKDKEFKILIGFHPWNPRLINVYANQVNNTKKMIDRKK